MSNCIDILSKRHDLQYEDALEMLAELERRTVSGVDDAGAPDWLNQLAQASKDLESQVMFIGAQMKRAAQWAEVAKANLTRRIFNGKRESWKNFKSYLTGDARKSYGSRLASIGTDQQTFKKIWKELL